MLAVLAGAVSNIGLNAFMIPICGAIGAAVATAVCEVMILVIMLILTLKMKGMSVRTMMKSFWKYLIAAAEMFCIMFIMRYFIPDTIWAFFVIGGAGTIVYVLMLTLLRDDFFIGLVRSLLSKVFVRKKGKSKR